MIVSGVLGSPVTARRPSTTSPTVRDRRADLQRVHCGLLSDTLVSELRRPARRSEGRRDQPPIDARNGNYADGTPATSPARPATCAPSPGRAATRPASRSRTDLPLHDMTGGNYWMPDDALPEQPGQLRLGGGLTAVQIDALDAGKPRAQEQLAVAASLAVSGNTLQGHQPDRTQADLRLSRRPAHVAERQVVRRGNNVVREDGAYGRHRPQPSTDIRPGQDHPQPARPQHQGLRSAARHDAGVGERSSSRLGYPASLPLSYDRDHRTRSSTRSGELRRRPPVRVPRDLPLRAQQPSSPTTASRRTACGYDDARTRNALARAGQPVRRSRSRWNLPLLGRDVALDPPAGAAAQSNSSISRPAGSTSSSCTWRTPAGPLPRERRRQSARAWLNTGMAEPYVMASTTWGPPPPPSCQAPGAPANLTAKAGQTQHHADMASRFPGPCRRLPYLLRPGGQAAIPRRRFRRHWLTVQ